MGIFKREPNEDENGQVIDDQALEGVAGGYIFDRITHERTFEVIDDRTGKVLSRFYSEVEAIAECDRLGLMNGFIDEDELSDLRAGIPLP